MYFYDKRGKEAQNKTKLIKSKEEKQRKDMVSKLFRDENRHSIAN